MITISLHVRSTYLVQAVHLPTANCHTVDLNTSDGSDTTAVALFVGVGNAAKVREYAEALLDAAAFYLPQPAPLLSSDGFITLSSTALPAPS